MGVGHQSNRVLAIIQARYRSTRLPGKILFPLPFSGGKPVLLHICEVLNKSSLVSNFVIATSELPENDCICEFAEQNGFEYYRGDENDVLSRFINIVEQKKPEIVIRLTADNPLQDVLFLDKAIQYHLDSENQYTKTSGMPLGMNFEIVDANLLIQMKNFKLDDLDREHVTKYIVDRFEFKKSVFQFPGSSISHLRCTIDYPSDYAMMNILFQLIDMDNNLIVQLGEIEKKYPWLFQINSENIQIQSLGSLEEEMNLAKRIFRQYGLNRVEKIINIE